MLKDSYTDCKTDYVESESQPDASKRLLAESETVKTFRQTCPTRDDLPNGFPKTQIDSDTICFAPENFSEQPSKGSFPSAGGESDREDRDSFAEVQKNYNKLKELPELPTKSEITTRDLELLAAPRDDQKEEKQPAGETYNKSILELSQPLRNSGAEAPVRQQLSFAPEVESEVLSPATNASAGPRVIINGNSVEIKESNTSTKPQEAVKWQDPVDQYADNSKVLRLDDGKGTVVTIGGNDTSNVLNQFRFNGSLTQSEVTGANKGPDFFPTRWNGIAETTKPEKENLVDGKRVAEEMKLTPEQEKAEKEFLERAAKDLEKQNLKLKPLHKGEGPYQAIERMVRSGDLPHMTSEQIKEHAIRIRNRDFEQMKRGYYKVGETPEFYSKNEIEKIMEAKKQEFRQRLQNEQKKAA